MLIRKVRAQFLLLCIFLYLSNCSESPRTTEEQASLLVLLFAQELQGAIESSLNMSQGDHDLGISAAVTVPGYPTWVGVYGNSYTGVSISDEMLFDAGSIAKNFEAALVLKLAEQGILDLDDPLSKWLPPYRNVDGQITIRQLLNHTSGIYNVFEHPDFPWVDPNIDYAKSWELHEVFDTYVFEPYGPPGSVQHYSSTNYLLLTAIIEKSTRSSVPELVERYFLLPLNLENTYISIGKPPPQEFTVAHPWVDLDRDGELEDLFGIPLTWKVTLTHPVLFSNPEDLVHWMNALYHDRSILSPHSLSEMLTFPEVDILDPEGGRYGLGVVDYSEVLGVQAIGHGGSSLGYSAAALYLPEYGVSLAWLFNTGESPPDLAGNIMRSTWLSLSEALRKNLVSEE